MNTIDATIVEILTDPYFDDFGSGKYRWWVNVRTIDEGGESIHSLMFNSKEEAEKAKIGDTIQV